MNDEIKKQVRENLDKFPPMLRKFYARVLAGEDPGAVKAEGLKKLEQEVKKQE